MKHLLLFLALAFPVLAARTTVTDTLQLANGAFCSGTLTISNPPFTNADGFFAGGSFTVPINAATGTFTVSLEPGPYYTVTYVTAPSGCAPPTEFWSVPVSATPVNLAAVRSISPPPPLPNTIPLTYITQSGAVLDDCSKWNGTNWAASSVCGGGISTLTIGTTTVTSGTTGRILYDNGAVLGEYPVGIGVAAALATNVSGTGAICLASGSSCVGAGTVTVVGSGNLTSTALVTGGGAQTLQTPIASATMDPSGNISTPGNISTGVGSGVAGSFEYIQGTAPSLGTTSVKIYAPASVTSYALKLPSAAATGFIKGSNSANIVTASIASLLASEMPNVNVLISTTGAVADPGNSADYQFNNAMGALTFNAPVGVAGLQRCYRNATGKSGVITIQMATSNTLDLDGANGSSAGTLVSGGALGDAACIVSDAANHWYAYVQKGTWTNN